MTEKNLSQRQRKKTTPTYKNRGFVKPTINDPSPTKKIDFLKYLDATVSVVGVLISIVIYGSTRIASLEDELFKKHEAAETFRDSSNDELEMLRNDRLKLENKIDLLLLELKVKDYNLAMCLKGK